MAVAAHLNIDLAEYDQRIRTFIPYYDEMLDAAADVLRTLSSLSTPRPTASEAAAGSDASASAPTPPASPTPPAIDSAAPGAPGRKAPGTTALEPTIVELGIGTGALAARALARRPDARIIGIDEDPAILEAARNRLSPLTARLDLRHGNFTRLRPPRAHATIASFALHHLPTERRKARLFTGIFEALHAGGALVSADAYPGSHPRIAAAHIEAWRQHLRQCYSDEETSGYFNAWAAEDTYFPLDDECALLARAGFVVDVVWRRDGFAVIAATKPRRLATISPRRAAS